MQGYISQDVYKDIYKDMYVGPVFYAGEGVMISEVVAGGAVEAFNKEVPQQQLKSYDMILEARWGGL